MGTKVKIQENREAYCGKKEGKKMNQAGRQVDTKERYVDYSLTQKCRKVKKQMGR